MQTRANVVRLVFRVRTSRGSLLQPYYRSQIYGYDSFIGFPAKVMLCSYELDPHLC